ncbi:MAG: TAXI family TRAP transporter solute-binding subunit [Treponema sp.]|nr:TAXI family TRAP transporter solute-binding subunit [Treponema sp.]
MKLRIKALFVFVLVLAVAAYWQSKDSAVDKSKVFITVATGPTSGIYYPIGGGIGTVVGTDLGYRSSVQSTGASVENINLILNKKAELAIVMSDAVLQAYQAFGAFQGQKPKTDLRGLMGLYPNYVQLVTLESSGIKTFKDLKGKRVGVGAPNSGVEVNARLMFEAHGMSYADIRPDYLNYGEAIDQMRNGMVDAAFVTSGIPNATVMDLATTKKIRIIPIEGEGMAYLKKKYPFFTADVIPAGTYGNASDVNTATIMNILLVSKDLPDAVAYDITKGIFEHIDKIQATHSAAKKYVNLKNALQGMVVPLHPGVEKYFKEVGILK